MRVVFHLPFSLIRSATILTFWDLTAGMVGLLSFQASVKVSSLFPLWMSLRLLAGFEKRMSTFLVSNFWESGLLGHPCILPHKVYWWESSLFLWICHAWLKRRAWLIWLMFLRPISPSNVGRSKTSFIWSPIDWFFYQMWAPTNILGIMRKGFWLTFLVAGKLRGYGMLGWWRLCLVRLVFHLERCLQISKKLSYLSFLSFSAIDFHSAT